MFTLILLCGLLSLSTGNSGNRNRTKVLLISLDGFRHDYLTKLPEVNNFTLLSNRGVYAREGVKNTFATVTFPTHYSIVTGLYEESHGIISNTMHVPELGGRKIKFTTPDPEDPKFINPYAKESSQIFKGEPVWNTLAKARQTDAGIGCMMFVGCSYEIGGMRLRNHVHFRYTSLREKIDQVITWFTDDNMELVLLYDPEPDGTGHDHGPDSKEVLEMLEVLNNDIGYLLSEAERTGLLSQLNIIVTGDHGMAQVTETVPVHIKDYRPIENYIISPAYWLVEAKQGMIEEAMTTLLEAVPPAKGRVFRKENLPQEYHYRYSNRIPSIVVIAQPGVALITKEMARSPKQINGMHGYSNNEPDMWPFFIAGGPQIREKHVIEQSIDFQQIDIYNLICLLLDIEPAPTNGSIERTKQLHRYMHSGCILHSVATLTRVLITISITKQLW